MCDIDRGIQFERNRSQSVSNVGVSISGSRTHARCCFVYTHTPPFSLPSCRSCRWQTYPSRSTASVGILGSSHDSFTQQMSMLLCERTADSSSVLYRRLRMFVSKSRGSLNLIAFDRVGWRHCALPMVCELTPTGGWKNCAVTVGREFAIIG